MSQALRIRLALESTTKRITELYEVICDGKNLCDDELNETLERSFSQFKEQANATKEPSKLQLITSKYIGECQALFLKWAARKGARKPDLKHLAKARGAASGKAVPVANRQNPPRQQFPVF